jgi:methylenetetrahydrofolate dehydrogenase (NAD+)
LVGFLATEHKPSRTYARVTARSCQADGIRFELREASRHQLEAQVQAASRDEEVHGIIVYYPVFGDERDSYLREIVPLHKDVEGLSARYRYNLYHDVRYLDEGGTRKSIIPCTPLAVIKILEHYQVYRAGAAVGEQLAGRCACIVNRSEVVGRPLASMLAHDGAEVFSVDIDGVLRYAGAQVEETDVSIEEAIRRADILITAVPDKRYGPITPEAVKPGVAALDLSGLRNLDPALSEVASLFGRNIGPVTVAMVERNLVRLLENFWIGGRRRD